MSSRPVQPASGKPRKKSVSQRAGSQQSVGGDHSQQAPSNSPKASSTAEPLPMTLDEDQRSAFQRIKDWLRSMAATGYGVSVVLHVAVLTILSLIVITVNKSEEPMISSAFTVTGEVEELTEVIALELEPLESTESYDPTELLSSMPGGAELLSSIISPTGTSGTTDGDAIGAGAGFNMPASGHVVTKGSFSAWTVPEDPKPREDYLVVIQIRLPEKIRKYSREDLSGFLEGDDGYQTPLGQFTGKGFPKQFYGRFDDEARQFVIKIPGGAAKVSDTIEIRSRVLREEQKLTITF
jgi:hypothetical protein